MNTAQSNTKNNNLSTYSTCVERETAKIDNST